MSLTETIYWGYARLTGLIAHEWIEKHGGAERVVDAMVRTLPDSDIFCLWNDDPERFPNHIVTESWIGRSSLRGKKAITLPFMPAAWRSVSLESYEWALVSSHLFAHHIGANRTAREVPVYSYIHTPARYIWEPQLDQRGQRVVARVSAPLFRKIDKIAASQGGIIAANSGFVRDRIKRVWGQESKVIYPPVQISRLQAQGSWASILNASEFQTLASLPKDFILGASRFVDYKRLPRVIEVGEICGSPVVLAGSGPALDKLRELAKSASVPVTIVEKPSDELLYALYEKAMLFVFPPIEDFGIMPVEAMALGTPVLVNATGGASESVELVGGGIVVRQPDAQGIKNAVADALSLDMNKAMINASLLSEEAFMDNIRKWMAATLSIRI